MAKFRIGFVANSSSSSFIVGYRDEKNVEILKKLFKCESFEDYAKDCEIGEDEVKDTYKKLGFEKAFIINVPFGSEELFNNYNVKTENFRFVEMESL